MTAAEARDGQAMGQGRGRAPLSIRTRLTLAIALLTAVVSVLAVVVGMRAMTTQVRNDAIDGRLAEVGGITGAGFLIDDQLAELREFDDDE
ncbi:MAG: hypothetical protein AAFO29_22985, partial [Actinomycetota bacterium]